MLSATLNFLPDQAALGPAAALLEPGHVYVADRNFSRLASPTWWAAGCGGITPPPRRHAAVQDPAERPVLRYVRHRVDTPHGTAQGRARLGRAWCPSWWGLHTRIASVLAADTVGRSLVTLGVKDCPPLVHYAPRASAVLRAWVLSALSVTAEACR